MAWNTRRNQLVAAVGSTVQVFTMKDPGTTLSLINEIISEDLMDL